MLCYFELIKNDYNAFCVDFYLREYIGKQKVLYAHSLNFGFQVFQTWEFRYTKLWNYGILNLGI